MFRAASPAAARTNTHLRILLSSLHLGGHQTDLIDAGAMSDIDRLGHPLVFQARIAFDEHHTLGAGLENLLQALAHVVFIGILTIDLVVMIGVDDDNNRTLV